MLEVDPEYMENQAIIPLEGAIGTLEGVEKLSQAPDSNKEVFGFLINNLST